MRLEVGGQSRALGSSAPCVLSGSQADGALSHPPHTPPSVCQSAVPAASTSQEARASLRGFHSVTLSVLREHEHCLNRGQGL